MKSSWKRFSVSKLVALAIIVGGVGGIIFGEWPRTGIALTIVGIIGALWDHHSSEAREEAVNDAFEVQALLFASKGIGNPYTELGKKEL